MSSHIILQQKGKFEQPTSHIQRRHQKPALLLPPLPPPSPIKWAFRNPVLSTCTVEIRIAAEVCMQSNHLVSKCQSGLPCPPPPPAILLLPKCFIKWSSAEYNFFFKVLYRQVTGTSVRKTHSTSAGNISCTQNQFGIPFYLL